MSRSLRKQRTFVELLSGQTWLRVVVLASVSTLACDVDLGERATPPSHSFGEVVYREACERVAYSGELAELKSGKRQGIDASGVAYRPMCNAAAAPPSDAPAIMQVVATERSSIVDAVNRVFPESLLGSLDETLRAMLPTLDGPPGRKMVTSGGALLLQLAQDPQAVTALSRLGWRDGFRPPGTEADAIGRLLRLSNLYETANAVLQVLWPSRDGGDDAPGAAARTALLYALSHELTAVNRVPNPSAPDRTLNLALRFLFTENPELRTLPAGKSYWGVLRDSRGMAQLNTPWPAPFMDADGDGLADVDADGHFKDKTGAPLLYVPPFPFLDRTRRDPAVSRDADGRALVSNGGTTLYRYINLDDTVLAGLLRDTPTLLDPQRDIPLRLSTGLKALLGPRQAAHKDYAEQPRLDYLGFDTAQAPLLDMLYSFLQLLGYSDIGDAGGADMARLLRGLYLLVRDQESTLARSLGAVAKAFDEAKKPAYASVQLAESSTLYDDLAPVLVRLLRQPGLLSDLLIALADPATAELGPLLATLMTDSDYFFMNDNQLDATQPGAVIGKLGKSVNRTLADSDTDYNNNNAQNNRSILQRVLHLVHDANGKQFCNKEGATPGLLLGTYTACELLQIDDLATFYLLTMADESVKNNIPETDFLNAIRNDTLRRLMRVGGALFLDKMLGIPGFKFVSISVIPPRDAVYPSPEAASRLLFQDNNLRSSFQKGSLDLDSCNPARPGTLCCNQNHSWQQHHNGALFALEAVKTKSGRNFYQVFRPIVNAFAQHNECIAYDASGNCTSQRNAAKILVDLLSILHRHWPTQQARFYGLGYEPQNKKSGVRTYEPLIAQLIGQGDLWPSSLALAPTLLYTSVDDGSNIALATLVNRYALWFFDPQAPRLGGGLVYRDGRNLALRNDGLLTFAPTRDPVIKDVLAEAAKGKVTPFDLLAEAFRRKRAGLAADPTIETGWKAAISNLADIYLSARQVGAGWKFQNPRFRSVALSLLDLLRERVQRQGASGNLKRWVRSELYDDISGALTGPIGSGLLDLLDRLAASPDARKKLPELLAAFIADPGPTSPNAPRFRAVLTLTADVLQLLLDDGDLVPLMQSLGAAFLPEKGAVDAALGVVRRGLPVDPNEVFITVGRNLFNADAGGLYPAWRLKNAVYEINRKDAGFPDIYGSALGEADYQSILQSIGQFLLDHERGGVRILDIVESRRLPP